MGLTVAVDDIAADVGAAVAVGLAEHPQAVGRSLAAYCCSIVRRTWWAVSTLSACLQVRFLRIQVV